MLSPFRAGIAIFDHHANALFPTPWRVDNQLGICPSLSLAGAWRLAQGAKTTWRYGLFVFCGRSDPAKVEMHWTNFCQSVTRE